MFKIRKMLLFRKTFFSITRAMHVEHKVKVNNININIVETGEGNNTLLLLPGTTGSIWSNFKPQVEGLPKLLPNYKIIAWDPPGYGKSIPPERSFTLDMFENDAKLVVDLMRELKREKFSVLGWSGGGVTALIIAGQFPEHVDKLIASSNGPYASEKFVKATEASRDVSQWAPAVRKQMDEMYTLERFSKMWSSYIDLMIRFQLERNGDICKADVKRIKAPTLILRGRKDPHITLDQSQYLLKHIKNSKYHEFPKGPHSIPITEAEEFNKIVAKFLLEN